MTDEDELNQLRQDKQQMQEHLAHQDELIAQMQRQLVQRDELIAQLLLQQAVLSEQVQALQDQLKKDSHNSHLPPSSDRFHRQPKSLRQTSGKKAGGQPGHPGSTLMLSPTPDRVIVHTVEQCLHCQRDLREVESLRLERRQVIDLPVKRVLVIEHQAQQKYCPTCQQISHAGQFVAPAWLVPFLLVVAVSTIEITTAVLPHYDTVSHSWRGRGPPLH